MSFKNVRNDINLFKKHIVVLISKNCTRFVVLIKKSRDATERYQNTVSNMPDFIQGSCENMCPEAEIRLYVNVN